MLQFSDFNENTLPEMLLHRATYSGNDIAYCFPELEKSCTWAELWHDVKAASAGLLKQGIKKNDRVMILMQGSMEFIISVFSTVCIGAVAVPVNTYSRKNELKAYFIDAKPAALIFGRNGNNLHYPTIVQELLEESLACDTNMHMPALIFLHGETHSAFKPFSSLPYYGNDIDDVFLSACKATVSTDPVFLIYTSGTTAFPKGVLRSTASFLTTLKNSRAKQNISKQAISKISNYFSQKFSLLSLLALYHMGGIAVLFTGLRVNHRSVLLTHFNPVKALDIAEKEKCSFVVGTPFMVQHMLFSQPGRNVKLDSLMGIAFSSSAINGALIEKITGKLKKLVFFTVTYGSSEVGSVSNGTCFLNKGGNIMASIFIRFARSLKMLSGDIDFAAFKRTPYSIGGKIDKNVEVKVLGLQDEKKPGRYEPGEILVKSHRVMNYASNTLSKESIYGDGWFRTGDLGYIDEQGYIVITGRIKRLISRGGQKISPVEIENELLKHPAISEVFVVSVPDNLYGEQICAAYVLKEDYQINITDIKITLSQSLAKFKIPEYFVALPELPLSPTGKIAVEEIRNLAMRELALTENA